VIFIIFAWTKYVPTSVIDSWYVGTETPTGILK
jgi:hypothetical protein